MSKTFSLKDANASLVFVRPVMKEVHKLWKELKVLREHAESVVETDLQPRLERLEYCFQELKQVGCMCNDMEHARVVFPSFYKDSAVYLSWQLGEDEVQYWHEQTQTPQDRRPISQDFIQNNNSAAMAKIS